VTRPQSPDLAADAEMREQAAEYCSAKASAWDLDPNAACLGEPDACPTARALAWSARLNARRFVDPSGFRLCPMSGAEASVQT
jgi:hypothetical protein